jgi:hypothetical protein
MYAVVLSDKVNLLWLARGVGNYLPTLPPALDLCGLTLRVGVGVQPLEPRLPAGARPARHPLPSFELDAALRAVTSRLRAALRRRRREDPVTVSRLVGHAKASMSIDVYGHVLLDEAEINYEEMLR